MTTFALYCYLFAATTLYAVLLAWLKHLWEPDLTWLEVVIGVASAWPSRTSISGSTGR
jgi:hypothetical protein